MVKTISGVGFTSFGLTSAGQAYDLRSSVKGDLQTGNGINPDQPTAYVSADVNKTGVGTVFPVGATPLLDTNTNVVFTSGSAANGDYVVVGNWSAATWTVPGAATQQFGQTTFAAGIPITITGLTVLSGLRATYAPQSATNVYSNSSGVGTLLSTSKITVDFASSTSAYADINLDVAFSAVSYNLRGGLTSDGSGFKGNVAVTGSGCTVTPQSSCGAGLVLGGIIGNNGGGAVVSYAASSSASGNFGGSASFVKGGTNDIITPQTGPAYTYRGVLAYATQSPGVFTSFGPGGATFIGDALTRINVTGDQQLKNNAPQTVNQGAIGNINDPGFIGWGRWVNATQTDSITIPVYSPGCPGPAPSPCVGVSASVINDVHYLVGKATPALGMPTTGTANYTLVGGTNPTATLGGTGQLVSASLNVNFGATTGTGTASVATQFNNTTASISNLPIYVVNNTATFGGSNANGFVSGLFTGPTAQSAGFVYRINNLALGTVNGSVALQRGSGTP